MQPLDLNLATRPFRNNTLPWIVLTLAVLLLGGITFWNVQTYRRHATWIADLEGKSAETRAQLDQLDLRERRAQAQIEKVPLDVLAVKAGKANEVIRWKAFSWTQLFNKLQEVMPNDAQMASVRPVFRPEEPESRGRRQTEVGGRVPVSVEGRAKSMGAFFDLERNLLRHPQFDRVDPEGTEIEKTTGNVVFRLRFLYDPTPPPPEQPEAEAEVVVRGGSKTADREQATGDPRAGEGARGEAEAAAQAGDDTAVTDAGSLVEDRQPPAEAGDDTAVAAAESLVEDPRTDAVKQAQSTDDKSRGRRSKRGKSSEGKP